MAILTEKEWKVEIGLFTAEFYAEYRNSVLTNIWVTLNLDGHHVTWSPIHSHGLIMVYSMGKITGDYLRLFALVGPENSIKIEKSVKKVINETINEN